MVFEPLCPFTADGMHLNWQMVFFVEVTCRDY